MKKIIKNNIRVIIILMICTILFTGFGVYANYYQAKDISFTPDNESWEVENVEDAINDLYKKKNATTIRKHGSINTTMDADVEEEIITDLYKNNTDKEVLMVYYFQTNCIGGEYVFVLLQMSKDNGQTWENIYNDWGNKTVSGKYTIPSGAMIRINTQKKASVDFYEIYFSEN